MKALFIGGTGTISAAIVRQLSQDPLWEVWVLNRGNRQEALPEGVKTIRGDIRNEKETAAALEGMTFDTVCEFIGFTPEHVEQDIRLFGGRTDQYIYISSASAYHKPAASPVITEGTALANPYWQYSRNKIACEELLMKAYRETGFPVTIVRPSHTYDERSIPVGVHGSRGSWQVLRRILDGKPVLIHGDGESLWTLTWNGDFARGFIPLMGDRHAIGEAFQITSDETLTWNMIYRTLADALGKELKAVHVSSEFLTAAGRKAGYDFEGSLIGDKAVSVLFDNRKVKRLAPDLKTHVPFRTGVRLALDHIMAHPELQVPDPEFDAFCDKVIACREEALERF